MTLKPMRVTYRGVFRSPIGAMNPLGLKIPVAMTIEVYNSKMSDKEACWKARELDTPKKRTLDAIRSGQSCQGAQEAVKAAFQEQCQEWQMWGTPPDEAANRVISRDEVQIDLAGKVFFKDEDPMPEDAKKHAKKLEKVK